MNKKIILISGMILHIYSKIGIDKPSNHDEIVDFIVSDVNGTVNPDLWHSGDVNIAFRRYLEKDFES